MLACLEYIFVGLEGCDFVCRLCLIWFYVVCLVLWVRVLCCRVGFTVPTLFVHRYWISVLDLILLLAYYVYCGCCTVSKRRAGRVCTTMCY